MRRVLTLGAVVALAAMVGTMRVVHNLLDLVDRAPEEIGS